jgi:DNA recombination protein RmuC
MDDLTNLLAQPIARLGATTITLGHALAAAGTLFVLLVLALAVAPLAAGALLARR